MNKGQIIPVKFVTTLGALIGKHEVRVQDFKLFLSRQR